MIIQFAVTSKGWGNYVIDGWGNYVLNGTKKKPRDQSKIKLLKGDIEFGDRITNTTFYKYNAYSIVLSFKGKPEDNIIKSALEDFEKMFMYGFSKDEYHLDAVLHKDTDDYHIHVRIPKLNLKTGTQLQLYMDKVDRYRVNLIRDYIDIKYNLESPLNNKKLIQEEQTFYIEQWRQQHEQKAFDFSKPKARKQNELDINDYVRELHQADLINSLDDVKNTLKSIELKIEKTGHDFAKDFHYITVSNESGKIRMIGDLYNEQFWEYSREDRTKQISTNQQHRGAYPRSQSEYIRIQGKLQKELAKRLKSVDKRYRGAREKADAEIEKLKYKSKQNNQAEGRKYIKERRNTNEDSNSIHSDNAIQPYLNSLPDNNTTSIQPMANTEAVQEATKERKIYSYTSKRIEIYERRSKSIHKNRRLNVKRDDRDTTNQSSGVGTERRSSYDSLKSKRESLHIKARRTLQTNRTTRTRRGRYRKTIDNIRTNYENFREQSNSFIHSAYGLIKAIKEFIVNKKMSPIQSKKETDIVEDNQTEETIYGVMNI